MKLLVVGVFAAALFAAGAASAGTIDEVVANTLTSTDASGATTTYLFNTDGAYTVTLPDGSGGSGAWRVSGSQFCFTPAGAEELCVAAPPEGKGPGDSWPATTPDGAPVTVSIVAGR